jgi:hypothetical protein
MNKKIEFEQNLEYEKLFEFEQNSRYEQPFEFKKFQISTNL